MNAPPPVAAAEKKPNGGDKSTGWDNALIATTVLLVPALIGLILFAIPGTREGIGIAVLTAAASFGVGAFFGFIFGIPRTLSSSQPGEAIDGYKVLPNTNLEQISDWLTKILVGVGLVQLNKIGDALGNLAQGLAPGLGGGNIGFPVAMTVIISFLIIGFIGAYLFTRLRLEGAFSLAFVAAKVDAQVEVVKTAAKQVEQKADAVDQRVDSAIKDLDQSSVANAQALALVENQLSPEGKTPTADELHAALGAALPSTREQAFYLARDQRRSNWRAGDKTLIAKAIPVFRALITIDDDRRFHRNYAELGYALKDQSAPTPETYEEARQQLSTAIDIRGPGGASGFSLYEFNRAFCKIKLDPALGIVGQSEQERAEEICQDLEVAAATEAGATAIREARNIPDQNALEVWLAQNAASPSVGDRVAKLMLTARIA